MLLKAKEKTFYQELAKISFSKTVYIGSYLAFNIHNKDNTGDWHRGVAWRAEQPLNPFNIMGIKNKGMCIDTSEYLGDEGIYLATDKLKQMGIEFSPTVYAATHTRVFADLVIVGIKKGKPLKYFEIQDFDDFMHSDELKQPTYDLLRRAKGLNYNEMELVEQWIKKAQEYDR